ncbi:MAG: type II toxin-antitoxin system VapB family antitoxin [Dermatophilaceae bacterium]|jgi:antitoxin VapB
MALNIKNERVCRLAKEAARISGLSQTSVLEKALEAYLAEHEAATARRDGEAEALLARMRVAIRQADVVRTVDDLYDEATGLPR